MFLVDAEIFGTGQVRSVETLEFQQALFSTTKQTAELAGFYYVDYLNQISPLIRVRYRGDGGIDIRLAGVTLLSFGAPQILMGRDVAAVRFPIRSGLLVQRGQQRTGELRLEIGRRKLVMAVEGYYSSLIGPGGSEWRKALYLKTQGRIHLRVAERFLDELAGRLLTEHR